MAKRRTRETHKARREERVAGRREEKVGANQKRDGGTRAREKEEEVGQRRRWRRKSVWSRQGHWDPSVQYLLEAAAPDTVLPAPIRTLGVQAGGAIGQEMTGGGAGQWGR